MNENERKAENMAEDMRTSLNKVLPKDSHYGYTPVQWASRTSTQEIGNFAALDSAVSELDADAIRELAERTGKSENWLRQHFKELGNQLDIQSVRSAYVIVECNIDHQLMKDPAMAAQRFVHTVEDVVAKHRPDNREIETNEITQLSYGHKPDHPGAQFWARYTFGK